MSEQTVMSVLNPDLYVALLRVFGEVEVINRGYGTGLQNRMAWPAGRPGFRVAKTPKTREEYVVNCPFCASDERLYVHYAWGLMETYTGNLFLELLRCTNKSKCPSRRQAQQVHLYGRLFALRHEFMQAPPPNPIESLLFEAVSLPTDAGELAAMITGDSRPALHQLANLLTAALAPPVAKKRPTLRLNVPTVNPPPFKGEQV